MRRRASRAAGPGSRSRARRGLPRTSAAYTCKSPMADEPTPEPTTPQIDPEVLARRRAAMAHIRQFGDPILRTKTRPVDHFDASLRDEIERMGTLMNDAIGVGLAAPQAGVPHRLLVYRTE